VSAPDLYDDALLYDLQYAGYRDDVPFYRRLAEDHGGPVVELGAGTGRLTVPLARSGAEVVAVEPNPAMRARLERRLVEAGLEGRVTVVAGDARTLDLPLRAPLVVAPFNTLMHLESLSDQDSALRSAHQLLAPGGLFACDVYVPRFAPEGTPRMERIAASEAGAGGDLLLWQEHDGVRQCVVTHLRLDTVDEGGRPERRSATLRQRYFGRYELERALYAAGFSEVRLFGDFGRGPFTAASHVMVFLARR
jgi:SAM-dependent methyltransferase